MILVTSIIWNLISVIKNNSADIENTLAFAFAFDGNDNQVDIITARGKNISPGHQIMLYLQFISNSKLSTIIVFDVKHSKI